MATSKSTVLGIRLDHDRRAWVEAAAAEEGVTVRGLFEQMIDRARTGETPSDTSADSPAAPTAAGVPIDHAARDSPVRVLTPRPPEIGERLEDSRLDRRNRRPGRQSPCADLARLAGIPG